MTCPRCGFAEAQEPVCPRCGVVFAKLAAARPRPEARPPARSEPTSTPKPGARAFVAPVLALLALVVGATAWLRHGAAPVSSAPTPPPARSAPRATRSADLPPPPVAIAPTPPTLAAIDTGRVAEPDAAVAKELAGRLKAGGTLGAPDAQSAEGLYARYPADTGLRSLLGAVLVAVGQGDLAQRRYEEAGARFRRAAQLQPAELAPRLGLLAVLLASGDWPAAEAAARDALALDGSSVEALQGLAFALFRQDRDREAADVLKTCLAIRETPEARALLDRIQKAMADQQGMTEQRLSHFNVHYDGETHDDVGREILRALERHYATLTVSLDHQPQATIAVILFSREQYYDASGAPAWSGGVYDNLDGRIRIPIGGLTASLTPDIDNVLIHEVTHAFIADRTRNVCPREIHEGLAQYMEGKRLASLLTTDQLQALADGRARGVGGFYLQALSFVEYLMAVRGQGGMNDVLKAMGQTGDVNESFRRVYGQDYAATQRAWAERARQQYGS